MDRLRKPRTLQLVYQPLSRDSNMWSQGREKNAKQENLKFFQILKYELL
jgi:hypothetical protein